jgi:hypothetical protein
MQNEDAVGALPSATDLKFPPATPPSLRFLCLTVLQTHGVHQLTEEFAGLLGCPPAIHSLMNKEKFLFEETSSGSKIAMVSPKNESPSQCPNQPPNQHPNHPNPAANDQNLVVRRTITTRREATTNTLLTRTISEEVVFNKCSKPDCKNAASDLSEAAMCRTHQRRLFAHLKLPEAALLSPRFAQ